jgi:hypothetical protein
MKTTIIALSLLVSQVSFAAIINSTYAVRHQQVIKQAIERNCGFLGDLTQVSSKEKVIQIDQGIRDVHYTTVLSGFQLIDQGVFDDYRITIKSEYADHYDHDARDWGHFSVTSVKCELD